MGVGWYYSIPGRTDVVWRVFDSDGPGAEHLVVRLGSENGCGSTLCMCPPSLSVL